MAIIQFPYHVLMDKIYPPNTDIEVEDATEYVAQGARLISDDREQKRVEAREEPIIPAPRPRGRPRQR